ncbi:MAG: hypothetical protein RSC01_10210 [Oscillospiraceae bacterium]
MEHSRLRCRDAVAFGMTEHTMIQLAASAVVHTDHGINKAIIRRARFFALPLLPATALLPAHGGDSAMVNGKKVQVGTLGFIRNEHVPVGIAPGIMRMYIRRGYLVRLVAVDGQLAGILAMRALVE